MINNLFFLQAVAVDGVSTICPVEMNCFIPHQTRLYESKRKMRADTGSLMTFAIENFTFSSMIIRHFYHEITEFTWILLFFDTVWVVWEEAGLLINDRM